MSPTINTHTTTPFRITQHDSAQPFSIAIVGSGCSGLKIAQLLTAWQRESPQQRKLKISIFESAPRVGGLIQTIRRDSGLNIECAAQGVLSSRTIFLKTLEALGLTPANVSSPPPQKDMQRRFVIAPHGRMAPLGGPVGLMSSGILSFANLLRAVSEFFRPPASPADPNETLFHFVERRFGRAVAENLILPLATGIWGGGAETLLARHAFPLLPELEMQHGGVIRGLMARRFFSSRRSLPADSQLQHLWPHGLLSFPQGMQSLVEAFEENLKLWEKENSGAFQWRLSEPVHSIGSDPQGRLVLNHQEAFDSVFWTAAPWNTPNLQWQRSEAQQEWTLWQKAPVHSLIVVNFSGPANRWTKKGFGVLARRESRGLLGVLFVHSIYPQHVPSGSYSYRVLLGGDRRPEMIDWSDEQIINYAKEELIKLELLDASQPPADIFIKRWNAAVGIADLQHDERQKALWRLQAYYPTLFFAGIYKKGVGVADALQSAQDSFDAWKSWQEH